MDADKFFASGARPPTIAPITVKPDAYTESWMEGAMRCNPPLNPLIDAEANHIFLLRFFAKNGSPGTDVDHLPAWHADNGAQMQERFLDAVFSVPLEKELETIAAVNHLYEKLRTAAGYTDQQQMALAELVGDPINFSDPASGLLRTLPDDDGLYEHRENSFATFVRDELDLMSHFECLNPMLRESMFARGEQLGAAMLKDPGFGDVLGAI
jgi:hypothetical protein